MTVLHIACIGHDRANGVNMAVPQMVAAQQGFADVVFWNPAEDKRPELAVQPDLVVFHEVYRPQYPAIGRALRRRGIPYVLVPHGGLTVWARKKHFLKKTVANVLLFGRFIRGAAAVQCLSKAELDATCHHTKFIGTNGVMPASIARTAPFSGKNFLYIGRLDAYQKGLDLLLAALSLCKGELAAAGCCVHLYGPDKHGRRRKLARLVQRYGLEKLVWLHDAVYAEEKEQLLLQADCFIQTSRFEGMPLGVLEALGCGLPCIVTAGTGIAQMLQEYDAGWAVGDDPRQIAAGILRVLSETDALPQKSKNARRLITERFAPAQVARQTLAEYERLRAGR